MEENKLLEFFKKQWSNCLFGLVLLIALFVYIGRSTSSRQTHTKKDYIVVRHLFERFRSGEPLALESLETAETIVSKHPELHARYDNLLAHYYLSQDNPAKGRSFAQSASQRLKTQKFPFYEEFAEGSLQIAEQNYSQAYVLAEKLERELQDKEDFETLRAFNLLRLAFLSKTLGNAEKQSEAWDSLQKLPIFKQIEPLFQQGTVSINNYFV